MKTKEKNQKKIVELIDPLVEHLDQNDYHYIIIAGKNGICSRYIRSTGRDLSDMLASMAENHETFKKAMLSAFRLIEEKT